MFSDNQMGRVVIRSSVPTQNGPKNITIPVVVMYLTNPLGDGRWEYAEGEPFAINASNIAQHGGLSTTIAGGEWRFIDPVTEKEQSFSSEEIVFNKMTPYWPSEAIRCVPKLRLYDALIRAVKDVQCDPQKKRKARERWMELRSASRA